jgi:hypothetical protein
LVLPGSRFTSFASPAGGGFLSGTGYAHARFCPDCCGKATTAQNDSSATTIKIEYFMLDLLTIQNYIIYTWRLAAL